MKFANQLYNIMANENMSAKETSERCKTHTSTISRYLNGRIVPSYDTACRIMESLGYRYELTKNKKYEEELNDKISENVSEYFDKHILFSNKKAEDGRKRFTEIMNIMFTICDYAGFNIEGRFILRDKKTGKTFETRKEKLK